jgi:hypothetical protein
VAFAVLTDDQYPERVAFMILRKVAIDFNGQFEAVQLNKFESRDGFK